MADPPLAPFPPSWPRGSPPAAMTPGERDAFLVLGTPRTFRAGAPLIREGESATDVFLILGGFAKVVADASGGRPVLLSMRTRGDLVGELAAIDGGPRSASVLAVTEVSARGLSARTFHRFLEDHPAVARSVQAYVARKLRFATRHQIDASGAPVVVRLARMLDQLGRAYGREGPGGVHLDVPLSQNDLAALVGAAQPSVERALARLRERGAITTGYRHLVIRDPGLLAMDSIGGGG